VEEAVVVRGGWWCGCPRFDMSRASQREQGTHRLRQRSPLLPSSIHVPASIAFVPRRFTSISRLLPLRVPVEELAVVVCLCCRPHRTTSPVSDAMLSKQKSVDGHRLKSAQIKQSLPCHASRITDKLDYAVGLCPFHTHHFAAAFPAPARTGRKESLS
jgi:hypothetical protein